MTRVHDFFAALADPTRVRILLLVRDLQLSVGELAETLDQSQPRVSRHVRILAEAGLVIRRDSPNGKRYARRGEGGQVTQAFGFDLTPLALRAGEFAALADTVRAEVLAQRIAREKVSLLRRDCAKLLDALDAIEAGVTTGLGRIFALHCDPGLDVGSIGLREGPITAASDLVEVRLTGRGGHTSRPHLTEDLTFALAKIMTEVPAALSRRLDPRSGVALVWGVVEAGVAPNVIPAHGRALGTLRVLDQSVWEGIEPLLREIVTAQSAPYGVRVDLRHTRGVPPVVNDVTAIADLGRAALAAGLTPVPTAQSLGGEDFSWLLAQAPGAMARLGTRAPGGRTFDLHQGDLVVDERALPNAVGLLVHLALGAARDARQPASR